MEPFVLQPTYSLHSLLRPNRSLGRADAADNTADRVPQDRGADLRLADRDVVSHDLCNV